MPSYYTHSGYIVNGYSVSGQRSAGCCQRFSSIRAIVFPSVSRKALSQS